MITKKTLLYRTLCSLIMVTGIHFLDGMPIIDEWFAVLFGALSGIILLVIASIVLAFLMAAFPFKSSRMPKKVQIRAFIPVSTISLTIISFIAFVATRLSYAKSISAPKFLCQKVKEGNFRLDDYIIERKGNIQTETDRITKKKSTSKVSWISDCEYELTNLNDPNDVTKVKIVSVTGETYKCVAISGNRTTTHELIIQKNAN